MIRPLALSLVFLTCAAAAMAAAPYGGLFDPAYRVVIPSRQVKSFLSTNSCAPLPKGLAGKVSATWVPDDTAIADMERQLPIALQSAIRDAQWIGPIYRARLTDWESIANHTRQYAGVVLDGKKRILVIGAQIYAVDFDGRHDLVQGDWQSKPAGACDGGPAQFFAIFDPDTEKFHDFTFSGTVAGYSLP